MPPGYCCGVLHKCIGHHKHMVHQPSTTVTFRADGSQIVVERDAKTSRFHCPRCDKSYAEPGCLQRHARVKDHFDEGRFVAQSVSSASQHEGAKTRRRGRKPNASLSSNTLPTVSAPSISAATRQTVSAESRSRRSSTRTLPPRSKVPNFTRTERALIRSYWKEEYTVAQICPWMHCGPRDVWYCINNLAQDNLEEDQQYLDGKLGDIINLEDLPVDSGVDEFKVKIEAMETEEVDAKLHDDYLSEDADVGEIEQEYVQECRDNPFDSNDISSVLEEPGIAGPSNASAYRRIWSDDNSFMSVHPTVEFRQATSALDKFSGTATLAPPLRRSPSVARSSSDDTSPHASGKGKERQYPIRWPQRAESSVTSPPSCPIRDFLDRLKRPLGCLQDAFYRFGVSTKEDLDALCLVPDQWDLLKEFLANDVTQFQWMILKDGLKVREATLQA